MPIRPIEVTTFSKIPSFVPFGVEYFTQDTADLYVGTGSSSGPAVVAVNAGGGGSVSSVTFTGDGALLSSVPSVAVTTTGTLTATAATQSGNKVIASPSNGASGALSARALVTADLPNSSAPTTTFPAAVTSLTAIGDSITLGFTTPQNTVDTAGSLQCYAQLLSDMLGLGVVTNNAVGGTRIWSIITQAYAINPTSSVGVVTLLGANDVPFLQANAANQTVLQNAYAALAAWLALPSSSKATGGSISYSSGWSSFTTFGLAGKFSSVGGNTATATVSGTTIYVGGAVNNSNNGTFTITVDGVGQGTFTPYVAGNTMAAQFYPYCFRVSGLSAGSHSVVVTTTNANAIFIQWMGGNSVSAPSPFIGVGNTLPQTGASAGDITNMGTAIANALSGLVTDGLNVTPVNTASVISLTAQPPQLSSDLIHVNNYGHALLAKKWYETFATPTAYPAPAGKGGDYLAQVLNTNLGITPSMAGSLFAALENFWAQPDQPGGYASINPIGYLNIKALNIVTNYNNNPVVSNGISSIRAQINLTAQSAAIANGTLLYAIPASQGSGVTDGLYRVTAYAKITTASDISSTLGGAGGFTLTWTDPTDSTTPTAVTFTDQSSQSLAGNTTTTVYVTSAVVACKASTNLGYGFGYTDSHTSTAMAYKISIRVEQL